MLAPVVVDAAVIEAAVHEAHAGRLESDSESGSGLGELIRGIGRETRVAARSVAAVAAPPNPLALEARGRQGHASALLEAAVDLGLNVERSGHADESAVERPPPEDVGHVLPAELETEPAVREVLALDEAVHHVDRSFLQTGDEPLSATGAEVGLAAGLRSIEVRIDAEVGVEAYAELDVVLRAARSIFALKVIGGQTDRLHETTAIEDGVSPRTRDLIGLKSSVAP